MNMYRPNLRLLSERRLRLANSSPDVKALTCTSFEKDELDKKLASYSSFSLIKKLFPTLSVLRNWSL
jgi:hypothetical protein